jgi:uncharacterized protein (TIGR02118 family)
MYKVSVMYPNAEDAVFDFEYYQDNHMKRVEELFKPYGLIKTSVDKGIGDMSPYLCIGNLYFETSDGYSKATAEVGQTLRDDIVNYTNIKPVRQLSEIL